MDQASVQRHADNTEREVVKMEWEGKQARAVITRRTYPTDVDDLWHACVTPDRLKRWFNPVTGNLHEGGNYQIEGNAHGTILKCEAPTFLAITWEMHGGIGWVNLKLESLDEDSTRMTLEHIAQDDDEGFLAFWEEFGPGSLGVGWELGLLALADHLMSGGDTFVADEAAWMASETGQHFVELVSRQWADADTRFGREPTSAREAGKRTSDFFSGRGGK
jgi:uncharacterized protein YndB with AHSA1/START domain